MRFLIGIWTAAFKWPLTFFIDALFLRKVRRQAGPGFDAWARAAAAAGPEAIARAVAERVEYVLDPVRGIVDFVTAPAVTWGRRYGDCDDFAYLSAELCRRAGLESWVVSYVCWNVKDSHVVCLYRDGSGYGLLDQGLLRGGFATLGDAASAARPKSRVAGEYVRRYGRGPDLIGKWIIGDSGRP
ncbi:MAG: transglutaminase domain-containing protein [Candidatus Zixiibacteriota bacterium]|jgi:hypothetical protein